LAYAFTKRGFIFPPNAGSCSILLFGGGARVELFDFLSLGLIAGPDEPSFSH